MFKPVRRRTLEWRRVAQFEPVRVEGAKTTDEGAADRPDCGTPVEPGMRVALKRDLASPRDRQRVVVESLDERTLGYLQAEVAAWVAPLLDSNRVAVDGRIYAVDSQHDSSDKAPGFYVALTQFELVPVEHSALARTLLGLAFAPFRGVKWCAARLAMVEQAVGQTKLGSAGFDAPSGDRLATDDKSSG